MPKEGFSTITVSNDVYGRLKEFAERTHRSIPHAIEYLIDIHEKED